MVKLLQGLRVVEGTAFVAAPLAGMTLAQMGADVIRFDRIEGGLDHHRWPVTEDGNSLFWAGMNKGKRSIALDLGSPRGRELAAALICAPGPDAGVFLTNLRSKGELDYPALKRRREDLIMVSVLGTRAGGPAVDYTVNPAVGFPHATGPEGSSEPVAHVLPAWDCITGQAAAMAVLAAERHRRITGEGQLVELALKDVALAMLGNLGILGEVMVNGVDRPKYGNALYGAFGQDFPTADGRRIMIVALTAPAVGGPARGHRADSRGRGGRRAARPAAGARGRPVQGAQGAGGPVRPVVRRAPGRGVRHGLRSWPGSPGPSSAPSRRPWPRIPTSRPSIRCSSSWSSPASAAT